MLHDRRNELHKSRQVQQPPIGRLFDTELVQYQAFPLCSRCSLGSSEWKGWKLRLYWFATKYLWITGPKIAATRQNMLCWWFCQGRGLGLAGQSAILAGGLKALEDHSQPVLNTLVFGSQHSKQCQMQKNMLQSPYVKHVSIAGQIILSMAFYFLSFDTLNHQLGTSTLAIFLCTFVPTGSSAKCAQHHHCQQYSNRGWLTRPAMVFGIQKLAASKTFECWSWKSQLTSSAILPLPPKGGEKEKENGRALKKNQLGYWTFGYSELSRWSPVWSCR